MTGLVDQFLQALLLGGLYANYALGLAISVGVLRFINAAHGDMIVAMSFLMLTLTQALGLPVWLSMLLLLPVGAGANWLLQRAMLQRVADHIGLSVPWAPIRCFSARAGSW